MQHWGREVLSHREMKPAGAGAGACSLWYYPLLWLISIRETPCCGLVWFFQFPNVVTAVRFYSESLTDSPHFHQLFLWASLSSSTPSNSGESGGGRCCLPSFPYLLWTGALGLCSTYRWAGFTTHEGIFISASPSRFLFTTVWLPLPP